MPLMALHRDGGFIPTAGGGKQRGIARAGMRSTTSTLGDAIQADAPVGWWRLNDLSGTTALDSSGNGYHGTYGGTFSLAQTGYKPSVVAPLFTVGWVDLPATIPEPASYRFSWECMLYETTLTNWGCYLSGNPAGGFNNNVAYFGYWTGTSDLIILGSSNNSWGYNNVAACRDTSGWHHFAGTYSGGGGAYTLYKDGAQIGQTSGPSVFDAFFVGGYTTFTARHNLGKADSTGMRGAMAECAYYDKALSAARVLAHYNAYVGMH